jgi:AraC-like DNA-binding protein
MVADSVIDYTRDSIWDALMSHWLCVFEPRPTAPFGRTECELHWDWRTELSDYDLWFPVRGEGQFEVGGRVYSILPGTLLLLRPGDRVYAVQNPRNRLTVIYIHFSFFAPGTRNLVDVDGAWLPARYVPFPNFGQLELLLSQTVRLLAQNTALALAHARLLFQQAILEIYRQDAEQSGRPPSQIDPRIDRVLAYLRAHPSARLSLAEAAAMAQLSTDYFSRIFRQQTGKSYRAYLLDVRLERSLYLLRETSMNVGAIAQALGYHDLFLYSRQFKTRYGYPPSQVRASNGPR